MIVPNPWTCTAEEMRAYLAELVRGPGLALTAEGGGLSVPHICQVPDVLVLSRAHVDAIVRLLEPTADAAIIGLCLPKGGP